MEINITWNVCRVCLQEENKSNSSSIQMRCIFDDDTNDSANTARDIFECANVLIKPSDSLPQKICRKCLQFLKIAVNFRNTCQSSNSYLQDILEKAKSTTSRFKMDKPRDLEMDENQSLDFYDDDNDNETEIQSTTIKTNKQMHKEKPTEQIKCETVKIENQSKSEELKDTRETIKEQNVEIKPIEEKESVGGNKSAQPQLDLSQMFLSADTDIEQDEGDDEDEDDRDGAENGVDFVNFVEHSQESNKCTPKLQQSSETEELYENEEQSAHYLTIKNLEAPLNEEEVEEHAEMLETNNLQPVNIVRNDDELFYIFNEDIMTKPVDEVDATIIDDAALIEKLQEADEDGDDDVVAIHAVINSNDDNDDVGSADDDIVMIETETNDFDETLGNYIDEDFVKSEDNSGEQKNDLFYENDEGLFVMENLKTKSAESMKFTDNYAFQTVRLKKSNYSSKAEEALARSTLDCTCPICGNLLGSRSLLKHHIKMHRNERNHECEICLKRFTTACNLTTHIRTHTGEKPFCCKFCDRRFSDKSTLVKHERSHTDERPYACQVCHKAFSLSSSLKAHERVHTGEKPYSCKPCGKAFKLSHQLKAHLGTNAHRLRLDGECRLPIET